jgi:hypothetical protein
VSQDLKIAPELKLILAIITQQAVPDISPNLTGVILLSW